MTPRVELLFWDGCPSHPRALADLRAAMADAGQDPDAVTVIEIRDDADAAREQFTGSPTIRVDGRDVVPSTGEPVQLACRVYRRRDGRISPVPDPDDLRDALRRAPTSHEGDTP
jgi:alkanesulfonate monooxygenase SsuD/methylene tetrahydromethanopterin reductase-like flavin-dependent oxidoreductase (luciferase family)